MSGPGELLIATSNEGKLREILAVLSVLPLKFKSLKDFPGWPSAVEDADTFMGNAEKKALHYARLARIATLVDDSGLEVDALGGRPGVYSARFAGEGAVDQANNTRLLDLLRGVPFERRTARFRCAMVLADPSGVLARAEGTVEGVILEEPRGTAGFGYDPLFWIAELGKTTAELEPQRKNQISHRGQALRVILEMLRGSIDG